MEVWDLLAKRIAYSTLNIFQLRQFLVLSRFTLPVPTCSFTL